MESEDFSDSNSSDDDGENDLALELIAQLREKINENPYLYDNHTEIIKLLKSSGELEKLREARENMSKYFPLTAELWLDWIKDEIRMIEDDFKDRDNIYQLFSRAVQDYQSVPLWLEYVQFAIGGMKDDGGISKMRKIFEEAITVVGLHVTQGSMVWDAYRETENAVLAGLLPAPGSIPTPEQEESFNVQNQRVSSLFKRQLAVPLLDMEQTYSEYKDWNGGDLDIYTEESYQKSLAHLEKLKPFEDSLVTAESPYWEEYQTYINFELKGDDPSRIQCIFERSITENCLNPEAWLKYTKYLDSKLKIKSVILPVYERAVRNCPWSCLLWQRYLLALERHNESGNKLKDVTAKALTSGFTLASEYSTIWSTYIDYLRRQINWSEDHTEQLELFRETIEKALENLTEYFGNDGDENGMMRQYWAVIEGKMCKNMTRAREIWNEIMGLGYGNQANMWLEYYKLERAYGDNKHCRKLLQKALNSVTDWPESITQAYINFEREEGTLEDYDVAVGRCEAQLDRLTDRKAKAAEKEEVATQQKKQVRNEKKAQKKFEKKTPKKEVMTPPEKPAKKSPNNKRKLEEPNSTTSSISKQDKADDFRVPPPPGYKGEPPPNKKQKTEEETTTEGVKHDPSKDDRTVFVSNLNFDINEDGIKEIFCKCGEISEIRLVKNFHGKSKGYAYVEFIDELPVTKALELDRQPVHNRPMYVSRCEDRGGGKKKAEFRFSTDLEKNKLFIKNLPFTCTKDALTTIFSQHGKLKDVRIITYRSGQPKGLAYVEYESEEDAKQAVLKTDGLQIGDHHIEVAISNPPARKQPVIKRDEFIPSLGGGKKESETRGKARTQIALLPRAVQKVPVPKKPTRPSASATASKNGGSGDSSAPPTAMSNSDFRNMLLKK
ncbi:hypothetical protein LOTGIDRAFT_188648 [Lottia gigantea]|uniref:RRM domain-containing protein n=1 Tax=Lottia gigantea TaxID=225164 RepID=V4AET9_LOTGI|nr:hypothetical protein LOTGIDRAFT_188648 [Lottia gigantea]ESO95367.1 hypothetical protein LOTGIDRAFT_188648 [Lottia gigantea]